MSPTDRIVDAAKPAAPSGVVDSSERATDHIHEEKSEVLEAALVKVLAMLGDLSERMCRMESSQTGQARQHRKDSAESSVFDSILGVGAAMSLQALERHPSPKRSPNLSPATYLSARRPAQVAGNYDMGQAPELGVHGQRLSEYHYPGRGIQHPGFVHPGHKLEGVPDSQQRRLALQPFDDKEIYHGLGSGFLECGKEFVRQISLSELARGFSWPEDIKVDVLDERLAGTAQKYYRR
uniref:Uncharacterized protein AlNc14C322G10609 n=1 Tax=Albugo laibachii Nc14 TaxID=890382 RepID=F0WWJ8_9STRA|nr:conserved hypothetical protein [Albugo laibachii Nc14]|eukprot:CCA25821.1 conserved hypothetical protein [Albugo laibachii Nc14]